MTINSKALVLEDKSHNCPYKFPVGYIYLLINKTNGHMYVGKHLWSKPQVDTNYWGSGGLHLSAAKEKYGFYSGTSVFYRLVLQWSNISDEHLKDLEKYWIKLLNTHENPVHYNETPGGDGFSEFTAQMRGYWGYRFTGSKNPMYGKHWSESEKEFRRQISLHPTEEDRRKMSEASIKYLNTGGREFISKALKEYYKTTKGILHKEKSSKLIRGKNNYFYGKHFYGEDNPNYGKHLSNKQKEKLSSARSKPVIQLDPLTKSVIGKYEGIRSAHYITGCSEYGIGACCRGVQNTAGGYAWKFLYDYTGGEV